MEHQPVLVPEILDHAKDIKNFQWMLDLTFGRGGHVLSLKKKFPSIKVVAFDQDPSAVKWARENLSDLKDFFIYHENFHYFQEKKDFLFHSHSIHSGFDLIIMDLGPSSPQLEDSERGFSFYHDGLLDMRMDNTREDLPKASQILNSWNENELFCLFRELGEIRNPRPVIRALLRQRKKSPIYYTKQWADLIVKAIGWRKKGLHPATPYFLALRMTVNNELDGLKESLPSVMESLSEGGRIFVLTFHSLEDRIVKNIFKNSCLKNDGFLVNKKVIRPLRKEILSNNRSRSAKLRIFQKSKKGIK